MMKTLRLFALTSVAFLLTNAVLVRQARADDPCSGCNETYIVCFWTCPDAGCQDSCDAAWNHCLISWGCEDYGN